MKKSIAASIFLASLLSGCVSNGGNGFVDFEKNTAQFSQPSNANKTASQKFSVKTETTRTLPDGTTEKITTEKTASQNVSGTWESMKEKFEQVRPVLWLGIGLGLLGLVGGFAAWKLGWAVNGAIIAAAGILSGAACVAFACWIPQINPLFGLGFLALLFIAAGVYYGYTKGEKSLSAKSNGN